MKANKIPEDIREYLRYEDGKVYWTKKPSRKIRVGAESKCISSNGYKIMQFKGKIYRVHRVVWFLVKDEQPPEMLDHINNNTLDNHIENLREVTPRQNSFNAKTSKLNKSGVKGVHWHKKNRKWVANISINNKTKNIGSFTELEEAEKAIKEFREKLHGEYANHG